MRRMVLGGIGRVRLLRYPSARIVHGVVILPIAWDASTSSFFAFVEERVKGVVGGGLGLAFCWEREVGVSWVLAYGEGEVGGVDGADERGKAVGVEDGVSSDDGKEAR
jgi:hypothetical protein